MDFKKTPRPSAPAGLFYSYAPEDEKYLAELEKHLKLLERQGLLRAWHARKIAPGSNWDEEIDEHLRQADVILLLVSADFMASDYIWGKELRVAMERHGAWEAQVIPVILRSCDLTDAPFSHFQALPKDGLPVDKWPSWDEAFAGVARGIRRAIGGGQPPNPSKAASRVRVNIDRLPAGGRHFVAREDELRRLDKAWADDHVHVLSIVAWGGAGKSALVDEWLKALERDDWRGARRVYGWSFYSQGTEERLASADAFIDDALDWFGDADPSAGSPGDRGRRLADLVRRGRTLLVLDGVEPLQHPPGQAGERKLKDPALAVLVKSLARSNDGLLVISTGESIGDLESLGNASAPRLDLGALSDDDGAALLELLGVEGNLKERREASSQYGGHALTLSLLGTYLVKACGGEIRQLPEIDLEKADAAQGGHAWRVIAAYESWLGEREVSVLRLLGLFDRPAEPEALAVLRAGPVVENLNDGLVDLGDHAWNLSLSNLRDCGLLAREDERREALLREPPLDTHSLVRAYFGRQLERRHPSAWQAGHERLFEHYKNSAPDRPDTLDEMMPLYAAVVHGCRAGKTDEAFNGVYWPRIARDDEAYQLKKLGAFGADLVAVGSFFVRRWDEVVHELSDDDEAWLLNAAGFELRALGRLREADQPMMAGLDLRKSQESWKNAAISACNLSELFLTLGEVPRAVAYGKESVELAGKSCDIPTKSGMRATWADALHQAGLGKEAAEMFREAEALQAESQPSNPRLYSLQGYQYCDFLLGRPGPRAWSGLKGVEVEEGDLQRLPEACEAVRERAERTLARAERMLEKEDPRGSVLDVALDNLSLGRAHFGLTLCRGADAEGSADLAKSYLDRAVQGLSKARHEEFVARGLLARAAFHRVHGERRSAEADLEEAEEIAGRGQMLLHLADVHLERTLVHLAFGEKVRARERLGKAEELVELCEYWRRGPDVAFLKGGLGGGNSEP